MKRLLSVVGLMACALVFLVAPGAAAQPPSRDDFPDSFQCWYQPRQGQYQCGYSYLDGRTTRWYTFPARYDPPDWRGGVDFPDYYQCSYRPQERQYRCGFWASSDGQRWNWFSWPWRYDPPDWWGRRPPPVHL